MSRTTFTKRPQSNLTPVRRPTVMVYAGLAYAAFAAAVLWAIAFLADLSTPHAVDGASRRPAWTALLIDACLLLVFAVQHSVMARAGSKQRLARILRARGSLTWSFAGCGERICVLMPGRRLDRYSPYLRTVRRRRVRRRCISCIRPGPARCTSPGHLRGPQIAAVTVTWRCSRGHRPRRNAPCAAGVM
jgi:hypothetical protein